MLTIGNTLHFINRIDETNCGDKVCCPLIYYFDFFKNYSIKRHDIRYIDFNSIAPTDVVILGGGGLFDYSEFLNRAYNRLLDTGASVIAWAPGLNTHTEYDGTFQTKVNFNKFTKINLRDYNNDYGIPYMPDVTCKLPGLKHKYTIKRKYGVARHKDYPIKQLEIYDQITNNADIDDILRFIGESEIVFSNSFHMSYWAMLMGKKTVCVDTFSSKFKSYKYKPEYCNTSTDDISVCVNNAKKYDILDECIKANDEFFEQVKEIIEQKLTPLDKGVTDYNFITTEAVLQGWIRDMQTSQGDILVTQLYINDGNGYFEEKKRVAINNVWGDDECFVRFDISEYSNIKELRFDPTEGRFCKVEIISAYSNNGDVELIPEASIRRGNTDVFLNTDPQYFIFTPCCDFLEIKFKLRLLPNYEAEQAVRDYVQSQNYGLKRYLDDIEQKNTFIESQNKKLNEQNSIIDNQNTRLSEQDSIIGNQNAKLNEQNMIIDGQNAKLNEQSSIIDDQNARLSEQDSIINSQNTRLSEQSSVIDSQNAKLSEQSSVIDSQNARLSEQSSVIDSQNAKLSEQSSVIDSQNTKLSEQSSVIDSQNIRLGEQNSIIENQNAKLNEQGSIIENQTAEIKESEIRIDLLLKEAEEKTKAIDFMQWQLDQTRCELNSLYNSRSWKITAPLRKLFSFFRRIFKGEKSV